MVLTKRCILEERNARLYVSAHHARIEDAISRLKEKIAVITGPAIRNLARSWTLDLKGTGIRVNVLSPGATATPGLLNGLARTGKKDAKIAGLIEQTPLRRMADPDDIADVALFLASDDSRSMTGSEIFADGGMAQV